MKATTAKRLRIGDKVRAGFSNSIREAVILKINWPHFTVETILKSGKIREEVRLYRALYPVKGPLVKNR